MGTLRGKVAFITGAARGQGRSHAMRLARDGADLIPVDNIADIETVTRSGATQADLDETVKLVENLDRRVIARRADVRDYDALKAALDDGVSDFGRLDIVVANAGIMAQPRFSWELSEQEWQTTVDINLTGVWHTAKAAIPHVLNGSRGGAIVLTSSVAGIKGYPTYSNYVAAKHGVIGLMKTLAQELGPMNVRVNALLPSTVNTPMIQYKEFWRAIRPDLQDPTIEDAKEVFNQWVLLPDAGFVEPEDTAAAVSWLVSDDARFVTGMDLRVDGGFFIK
jgi:(+)-trans-carveol dehydrogenase